MSGDFFTDVPGRIAYGGPASSGVSRWSVPRIAHVLMRRPSRSARATSPAFEVLRLTRTQSSADDATCAWMPQRRRTTPATG